MTFMKAIGQRTFLKEFVFQLLLFVVVFVFYTYSHVRRNEVWRINAHDFWFFLNYAAAVCVINYVLLPKFLYRKRYFIFTLLLAVLVGGVMALEEGVIEKIYFPTTRGAHFPGIFFNLAGILPVIAILSGFKFAWDALHKQREVEALKSLVKESELQFLRSQINPHFLFNNLNNLYSYALEQSPKTPEIILELSAVLRYTLYESTDLFVPLNKEIEQLDHFVNLSKLQLEDRGEVQFSVGKLPPDYTIAPLILSVFVENAFKHSVSSQSNGIVIRIETTTDDSGKLHFVCENTYSEDSNTDNLAKGIGLDNVRKRLLLLYPDMHTLAIHADGRLFRTELTLQLEKN